ncbi:MAG: pseudouridine synthase [Pseudomonadota bacterium]
MAERTPPEPSAAEGERIAKRIARSGLCSRRDAEKLIALGRVQVDGDVLRTPAHVVGPDARIEVDGELLPAREPPRLVRFHKPTGVLVARRDPEGRSTIYDQLPRHFDHLMPVGRLDLTSEGLLLLTNDGALKRHMELPATGWARRYRVRVWGKPEVDQLRALADGVTVDGVRYGSIEANVERQQGDNAWLIVKLREGKNREVRRVLEHLGYPVNRLIRTAYGPFQLGRLARGHVDEVTLKTIKEQVGKALGI